MARARLKGKDCARRLPVATFQGYFYRLKKALSENAFNFILFYFISFFN